MEYDWKEMCAVLLIVCSASMVVSKLVFYAQSCMMEVCNEGNMSENNWQEIIISGSCHKYRFCRDQGFVATSIIMSVGAVFCIVHCLQGRMKLRTLRGSSVRIR